MATLRFFLDWLSEPASVPNFVVLCLFVSTLGYFALWLTS